MDATIDELDLQSARLDRHPIQSPAVSSTIADIQSVQGMKSCQFIYHHRILRSSVWNSLAMVESMDDGSPADLQL
jgi:hypothetical protein